jgi:hypothetical protein
MSKNGGANPENRNCRYLAASKGISLNFLLDSETAILFFRAAGFTRPPTPPFLIMTAALTS